MRVALVTGAARGIGAATARRLSADGYAVLALDACQGPQASPYALPTRADLDRVVADCAGAVGAPGTIGAVVDVREPEQLAAAVEQALSAWGRLDVVVANAAVIVGGTPLWQTPASELDLLWQTDVLGVWHTAAATVPALIGGPDPSQARFVAVASAAGTHGLHRLAGYSMAKHAVVGLVKGLAADLVGTGVCAVAVSPGSTDTAMLQRTGELYDVPVGELAQHSLLRRVIDPEEIAATIAFAASPAGAVLNGSVVHADGGFSG